MSDAELPPVGIVFFDLGNVLVRFDAQRGCANLAAIANCDTAKVKEVVYDSGLQWRYEAGELSCQAFADIVNAGLGSQLASERLLSALADMFVVDPHRAAEARAGVPRLTERGGGRVPARAMAWSCRSHSPP